jgi:hypothetical protein
MVKDTEEVEVENELKYSNRFSIIEFIQLASVGDKIELNTFHSQWSKFHR